MTQTIPGTINPNTKSGTALATDLNNWQDTLHSMHLGSSQPSYAGEGLIWADNTSADLIYNAVDTGTADVPVFQIDATNHVARVAMDNDGDSYLHAATDDKIRARLGGTDVLDLLSTGIQTLLTNFDFFDANGNTNLRLAKVASAVNYPELLSAATGNGVEIAAKGSDANIDLLLKPKGTGVAEAYADVVPDTDSSKDLGSASKAWAEAHADKVLTETFEDRSTGDSVGAAYVVHGTAKAWANLNGTGTIALRDSFNISSVVDDGTGQYTFSFSNNMSDAVYSIELGDSQVAGRVDSYSASSFQTSSFNSSFSATDSNSLFRSVHGDLA